MARHAVSQQDGESKRFGTIGGVPVPKCLLFVGFADDEDLFAGMDQFQTLADLQLLFGWALFEALDAVALALHLLREVGVLLFQRINLVLLLHQGRDTLRTSQGNESVPRHGQQHKEKGEPKQRRFHSNGGPENNGNIGFPVLSSLFFRMIDKIVVLTTCGSEAEADRIARTLVEERLAACASVVPQVRSHYRWKDAVESAQEWLILIKSSRELYAELEARLAAIHSYEVPEILALPVEAGSTAYLEWLAGSLRA